MIPCNLALAPHNQHLTMSWFPRILQHIRRLLVQHFTVTLLEDQDLSMGLL
jgi:hypothetical protein